MLKVEIPKSKDKLQQQIAALEYQIAHDTNEKDKQIHEEALNDLKSEMALHEVCKVIVKREVHNELKGIKKIIYVLSIILIASSLVNLHSSTNYNKAASREKEFVKSGEKIIELIDKKMK